MEDYPSPSIEHDELNDLYSPGILENIMNIKNGQILGNVSPEEEVIKFRGKKKVSNVIKRYKYEELSFILATRQSPNKLSSNTDITSSYKSPTSKKQKTVEYNSQFKNIRIRPYFRKRLSLDCSY